MTNDSLVVLALVYLFGVALGFQFGLALLCLFGLALACLFAFRHKRPAELLVYHTLADVQDILSGEHLPKVTLWRPASTPLQSRAIPNERLIRAFGINNAFTTTDENYHKEFLQKARGLLQRKHDDWRHLGEVAKDLTEQMTREGAEKGNISLVTVVQVVALKVAIHVLFDMPIDKLADGTIGSLAKTINKLWIGSKAVKPTDSLLQKHQQDLEEALKEIFLIREDTPRSNPLNLILPAYETLWRVVLRCFVEVKFRSGTAASAYHRLFRAFLSNPTQDTFVCTEDGISVSFIVSEALRLYPPTRRVYRQITRGFWSKPKIVAADIEALQRDPHFWGEDSLCFNPLRWTDKRACPAYMPFGTKPFLCPARNQFGPWMIGMLVAALVAATEEGWTWKAESEADSIVADGPLSMEREDYGTLELCRESSEP